MSGTPEVEAEGLASATAEQQREFGWVSDVASAAMPEFGSMTAQGRHYPTMSQRKRGSTVALLRRAADLRAIYLQRRLDPGFREEIMLSVAGANSCRQCSFAHRQWALAEGVSEAEPASLEGLDIESFDARTWAAIAWAQAYARGDFGEVPDAIDANFRRQFGPQEQADIELVVRTMYWMNEASNGVRAGLKRAKHTPVPGSTVPREPQAALLYAVGAPVVLGLLCVKQRRNPLSMLREIRPFFREFEDAVRTRSPGPGRGSAASPGESTGRRAGTPSAVGRLYWILALVALKVGRWLWRRRRARA